MSDSACVMERGNPLAVLGTILGQNCLEICDGLIRDLNVKLVEPKDHQGHELSFIS